MASCHASMGEMENFSLCTPLHGSKECMLQHFLEDADLRQPIQNNLPLKLIIKLVYKFQVGTLILLISLWRYQMLETIPIWIIICPGFDAIGK